MLYQTRLRSRLIRISQRLVVLTAVTGGLSIIFHLFGPAQIPAMVPGVPASSAIVLSSLALFYFHKGMERPTARIGPPLYQLLSLAAFVLSLLTLLFYLLTDIPQVLEQRFVLAPVTALVVLLVAAAIFLLSHSPLVSQTLALIGLTVCILALTGYIDGTSALAQLGAAFPMRVPAAILLLAVAACTLCARPDQGPMTAITSMTPAGTVSRRVLLPLVALPLVLNFLFHQVARWGWYAPGVENALFTFAVVVTIATLVGWQIKTLYLSEMRRRQLENQALQSEGQFAMLVQAVSDYAIFGLDPEGRVSSWNTGAQRIKGYQPQEILGQKFEKFFHEEEVKAGVPKRLLEQAKREGRVSSKGWRLRKDGTLFYAQATLTRIDDADGQLQGFAKVTQDITARRHAEEEQIKLRSILKTVADPILVIDHKGIIETFNPAAEREFGYSAEEVLGQNISILMPEPDKSQHDEYLRRYMETREARVIGTGREVMARRKDGSLFPAELTVSEMMVSGRRKFTGIVRDISARKAAEDAVKRSETRLSLALEAGNIGIWEVNLDTGATTASGPVYQMLGALGDEATDINSRLALMHPEDRKAVAEQFEQILRGERTAMELEHRVQTRHGTWHWLRSRGQVSVRDGEGKALRMHGASVDIHQRKVVEEDLRKSKLDLQIALKDASFHLWHYHVAERRLEDLNLLLESLGYGHSPQTEQLSFWLSILHPDDRNVFRNINSRSLTDELMNSGMELRLRTKDGSWRWMMTRARVIETDRKNKPTLIAGTCLDITRNKFAEEKLLHAAQHDSLTGLPNRALTYAFGSRLLTSASRHEQQCAVLFVDLDHFKPINDNYGHAAGDAVLREVAARLRHCVRGEDVVGRLGGDEFLVILANLHSAEDINRVATDCLKAVRRAYHYQDLELHVSPSIGISLYPDNGKDMQALVRSADTAMYHAKESGRNNFQFFTPAMNKRAKTLLKLEGRLRRAIEQDDLVLHYQPVVDVDKRCVVSAEALLRWPSETIGPEEFIPIAEASGLIVPLGEWVIHEACQQQKVWSKQGMDLNISVNVSPLQFRQHHFIEQVIHIVRNTTIDPTRLQFEITENAVMHDIDEVVRMLATLREAGISIALDDFGKGYSSLNYLKNLPLDTVKVDKVFIHEMQNDKVNLAITEAIINLGESLGLEVIAEGIETRHELQLLRTKRCHHMQGFYLSHPLAASEFENWYRDPFLPGSIPTFGPNSELH